MPQPLPRARLLAVLFALLALFAAGCGSDDTASANGGSASSGVPSASDIDLSGVTLHVADLGGTQQPGLEAAGEADTPYKIAWSQFPSGPPAIEAINAGAVDLALMGDTPPIFAANGGVDAKVVAVARAKNADNPYLQIVVPQDSSIQSVADLKGKTVAVSQNTIMEYFLRRALDKDGVDFKDIKPAYLQPPDAETTYASGSADALVLLEPLLTVATGQRPSRTIAVNNDYFVSQTVVVARGKALDDPKLVAAIGDYLQRLERTYQWEQANLDQWSPIYSQVTKLPAPLASKVIAAQALAFQPIDDAVVQVQQDQIDTWSKAGSVRSGLAAKDEFDTRYNQIIQESAK